MCIRDRHRGFNPEGRTVGGNLHDERWGGIEVHPNAFDPWDELGDTWNSAGYRDRVDAVIVHEYLEFLGHTHEEALGLGHLTDLPISERARQILQRQKEVMLEGQ